MRWRSSRDLDRNRDFIASYLKQSYRWLAAYRKFMCVRRLRQVFLGLMLLVLGHGTMSWACSCVPQTPCGVHRHSDADFVGEVLSRRAMPSDDKLGPYGVMFNVRVIESLRGISYPVLSGPIPSYPALSLTLPPSAPKMAHRT
jgi:hypothetical protein